MDMKEKLHKLLSKWLAHLSLAAADDLIAHGVTVQSGIDANTFRLMRECERLKEEKESLANAVNVLEEINSDLYKKLKGVTVQEWISVKDRLPEKKQDVLCSRGNHIGALMDVYTYMGDDKWDDTYGNRSYTEDEGITHWQHLPQPPKGE